MSRVIGGKDATPHSWPWQAEIQEYRLPTQRGGEREWAWDHKCGGSLIHREWIITAAHCLSGNPDPRIYRIILGSCTFNMVVKGSNETRICPFLDWGNGIYCTATGLRVKDFRFGNWDLEQT